MERMRRPRPPEIDLYERFLTAEGLVSNFKQTFPDPNNLPHGYLVDSKAYEKGTLSIVHKKPVDGWIEQLIIAGPMIKFIEKKKGKYSRVFLNSIDAINKAERFMDELTPIDDPYSNW